MKRRLLRKPLRKPLALLLTLIMLVSLLPTAAPAEEGSTIPAMSSLNLYKDSSRTESLPLTPAFSSDIYDYEMDLPDYLGSIYAVGSAVNEADYVKTETAAGWGGGVRKVLLPASISGQYLYSKDKITFRVGPQDNLDENNGDTFYNVKLNKRLTLKKLKINDTLRPVFDPDITSYTAGINEDDQKFTVTLDSYSWQSEHSINGEVIQYGGGERSYEFDLHWEKDGTMPVEIKIANGTITSSYHITLIKETKGDVPVISVNPQSAAYDETETAKPLTVKATASGELAYQWYKNSANSSEGGTAIEGATSASYTPEIPDVSESTTQYYYCKVTNTAAGGGAAVSDVAAITVYPDATPAVTCVMADGSELPEQFEYNADDTALELKVEATSALPGGVFFYTWKQVWGDSSSTVGDSMSENNTFRPYTRSDGETIYFCTVTYIVNGRQYKADSAKFPPVRVYQRSAPAPYISEHPKGAVYNVGDTEIAALRAQGMPEGSKGGTITHQWFSSIDGETYEPIDGAVTYSYTPPAMDSAGVVYYKCRLTNTFNSISGDTYTSQADSAVAIIRFINGYTEWDGKGSKEEPFLIKDVQDLEELREYVNTGTSFEDYYFKMANDLTLPAGWTPIGAVADGSDNTGAGANINPFSATFDGGGNTLTISENEKPLFEYVRLANIENLNIYGEKIAGAALINRYTVDYGPSGEYSNVPKYTADIRNVTLKSGSQTLLSGFVNGNGSGMNNVYFTNCTVEDDVIIGYDKTKNNIGSFISCLNGNILNCVSYADVYGVDNVGGLVGEKGQSMGDCTIWDSSFHGTVTATGEFAGGIMGRGYTEGSAPNSPCVTIQNCYATGNIKAADYIGGIFGGEGGVMECWENGIGYIQNNYFTGTLTPTADNASYVGGTIGFMKSLDRYNIISNNYYLDSCGAEQGIGAVEKVDKTSELYSRDDDPTGVDAVNLTKAISAAALSDGTLLTVLNSGMNSSGNWVAGEDGRPVFGSARHILKISVDGILSNRMTSNNINDLYAKNIIILYSDRSTESVSAQNAAVQGFDTTTKGFKTVTVTYNNHSYVFRLQVTNPSDNPQQKITVTFRLIGDTIHPNGEPLFDGYINWIKTTSRTLDQGSMVSDLFDTVLKENDMDYIAPSEFNGNYISSIQAPPVLDGYWLSQFTNGSNSGWMYTVNGVHPQLGLKEYVLEDGDEVIWHYTNDYTLETSFEGSTPLYDNPWLNAPDINPALGEQVNRIAGDDRYDTSAQTALQAYPGGAETVIIVRGDDQGDFADALAANYLAGLKNAPILLTSPDKLSASLKSAIQTLGAKKAIVLGGTLAVSSNAETELKTMGLTVTRLSGANRYDTAARIAAEGGQVETAIVVGGLAPADSLVAGPLAFSQGYPLLLVDKNSVPAETKKALTDLGVKKIIVIGGENAVSKAAYDELGAHERCSGHSRIETSVAVAERFFAESTNFSIVGYLKLPDAVGAAVNGNPIIYVKDNISDVKDYLTGAAAADTRFTIFGGTLAVSNTVEEELQKLLQ